MSWSAHDLEPYAIQRHSMLKLAFVPLLIGSYSPDMMSKWFVYGIHIGGWELKAHDPAQFHRGWPGSASRTRCSSAWWSVCCSGKSRARRSGGSAFSSGNGHTP